MKQKRIDFVGRLDGRTELGDGSVRYQARLTRVGVFDYGDHRELRLPEDVFHADALASFRGLVVTDGHRAWVDSKNWKDYAIGHVGDDVRKSDDGVHVEASVILKDAAAIARADTGELAEISMGYAVNLEPTKGEVDGVKYDSIQRDIRGNHAALGPDAWGRAGASVRLLDGAAYGRDMSTPANTPAQRIDAPSQNEDQIRKDLDASRSDADSARKERDAAKADLVAANKRADKAEAERDAAKLDAAKATEDAKKTDARVEARVQLVDSARGILGKEFSFAGKSDRDVRVAALTKVDPNAKFDGKSDDYVAARFDLATETVTTERAALASVNETITQPTQNEDATESVIDKARREFNERSQNAWKPKK